MLYKYSDYIKENSLIKEGLETNPSILYWYSQFEKKLNENWVEISTKKFDTDKYYINFRIENSDKYGYYKVLVERKGENDFYYMEDNENDTITKFQKKLGNEFWKKASVYVENMKYDPKFLGDLSHVRDSNKYNM